MQILYEVESKTVKSHPSSTYTSRTFEKGLEGSFLSRTEMEEELAQPAISDAIMAVAKIVFFICEGFETARSARKYIISSYNP
jgi:hypothetical protein